MLARYEREQGRAGDVGPAIRLANRRPHDLIIAVNSAYPATQRPWSPQPCTFYHQECRYLPGKLLGSPYGTRWNAKQCGSFDTAIGGLMRKPRLRSFIVIAAIAVASLLGVQSASFAASNSQTLPFQFDHRTNGNQSAVIPLDWKIGDCVLHGVVSYAEFVNGVIHVHSEAHTNFTTNADIWHSSLIFRNSSGSVLMSTPTFDSPRMVPISGSTGPSATYVWDRFFTAPGNIFTATSVTWNGSC
ncbi:hypothetical protein ACIBBG_33140 [Micromonospora chersina]|uniref:hypothetical protein n=1 Tax=Micromonospora chersina TaxID=47854 RepID=UPI0037BB09DA